MRLPAHFDGALSTEDRTLLDRHLSAYLKLLDGRADASTEARKHFLAVANGNAIPLTPHEAAFVRWQLMVGWRSMPEPRKPQLGLKAQLSSAAANVSKATGQATASIADWANLPAGKAVNSIAVWYNALLATDASSQLDRWMRENLSGDTTIYDQAMDAAYVATKEGGPFHRIFDGGHDVVGAWNAVRDASDTDTFVQEVTGYLGALWNDVITPMGLPIGTIEKEAFDQFAVQSEALLGVSRTWLADAATVTATELGGVVIGALAVCLGWKQEEAEEVAKLAGSLLLTTALAASPFLLVIALVCLARAYQVARHGGDLRGLVSGLAQGGVGTAAFVVAASLVSGPVWVSILAGVMACVIALKFSKAASDKAAEIDWEALARLVLDRFRKPSADPGTSTLLLLPAPSH